jgi:hypothetical protein
MALFIPQRPLPAPKQAALAWQEAVAVAAAAAAAAAVDAVGANRGSDGCASMMSSHLQSMLHLNF